MKNTFSLKANEFAKKSKYPTDFQDQHSQGTEDFERLAELPEVEEHHFNDELRNSRGVILQTDLDYKRHYKASLTVKDNDSSRKSRESPQTHLDVSVVENNINMALYAIRTSINKASDKSFRK